MIDPLVNSLGEKHIVWARQAMGYRPGVEIGIFKEVPAHDVPVVGKPDERNYVKTKYYDASLVWKEAEWGTIQISNPQGLALLPWDMAVQLMEALWNAGVRPAAAMGSIGQLAATEKHLEDMRVLSDKLVDKLLLAKPAAGE